MPRSRLLFEFIFLVSIARVSYLLLCNWGMRNIDGIRVDEWFEVWWRGTLLCCKSISHLNLSFRVEVHYPLIIIDNWLIYVRDLGDNKPFRADSHSAGFILKTKTKGSGSFSSASLPQPRNRTSLAGNWPIHNQRIAALLLPFRRLQLHNYGQWIDL